MSETIPGGLYQQPDGSFKNGKGEVVKLTAEIRKLAKEAGIKLPAAKKKSAPAPKSEPEPEG